MTFMHPQRAVREAQEGQAMAEFVIWVFVMLLMISGILWFGKAYDLKLNCLMASRYMSWAMAQSAETDLEQSQIEGRATVYYPMTDNDMQIMNLDAGSIFPGVDSTTPGAGPFNAGSLMQGMFGMASNTTGYEVSAKYAPNGILDDTLPDGTSVRSRHYVSGGTWHKKHLGDTVPGGGDTIIMMVKGGLFGWSSWALSQY